MKEQLTMHYISDSSNIYESILYGNYVDYIDYNQIQKSINEKMYNKLIRSIMSSKNKEKRDRKTHSI